MDPLNTLIICLIIAALLPYIAKAPLAWAMKQHGGGKVGGYDNQEPRLQQQQLSGFGARCLAAHENSFEALQVFTASVLLVVATGNVNREMALLAVLFVICRVFYLICYWVNFDKLRSTVWAVGIISCFVMMFKCLN